MQNEAGEYVNMDNGHPQVSAQNIVMNSGLKWTVKEHFLTLRCQDIIAGIWYLVGRCRGPKSTMRNTRVELGDGGGKNILN